MNLLADFFYRQMAESALVMDFLLLIIFVQILLESLPVSSSGHLVLLLKLFFGTNDMCPVFFDCFTPFYYSLHGVTVCVALIFFYDFWKKLLLNVWNKKTFFTQPVIFFFIIEFVTLIGFLIFKPFFKNVPLIFGFMITAFFLFNLRKIDYTKTVNKWRFSDALLIGLAQTFAFIPGVSRFGITYFIARLKNFSADDAFAISFIAFVPLGIGGLIIGLYQLHQLPVSCFNFTYIVSVFIAAIGSYLLLYFIYFLIKRDRLWWLGWYMILPIIVALCI